MRFTKMPNHIYQLQINYGEGGGLSVHGVGSFGNVNNVMWCKGVSVDLMSVAKLGRSNFIQC